MATKNKYLETLSLKLKVLKIIKEHFPMHIYDEDEDGCVLCIESPYLKCAYCELDEYEMHFIKEWLKLNGNR